MGEAPVPEEQLPSSDAERIDVTGDGGVVKQITREGDPAGDCPPKSSMCFVNYRCWVLTEDEEDETHRAKIHDTWERGEAAQLSAGRDSSLFERGVTLALSSMRKGETALVHCTHPYGYGSKGHFSFPHVPGYASLLYQVELLDWDSPDDSRERATMTYEERCEAAERRKIQGNALFKEGRLEEALAQYDAGLSFINEDFIIQLHGFHMAHAQRIRCPILLNQAAAYTRQGKLEEAVLACGEVLQVDRKSSKALFRRGRARLMLGQTDPAREDLEAAARPSGPSARGSRGRTGARSRRRLTSTGFSFSQSSTA